MRRVCTSDPASRARSKRLNCSSKTWIDGSCRIRQQNLSHPPPKQFDQNKNQKKGRRIMVSMEPRFFAPWKSLCPMRQADRHPRSGFESGPGRTSYLWHCWGLRLQVRGRRFSLKSRSRDNAAACGLSARARRALKSTTVFELNRRRVAWFTSPRLRGRGRILRVAENPG